jgi:hypothetical protein
MRHRSRKIIGNKVYEYEYNDVCPEKRKKAAQRTSNNICIDCGTKYLNSRQLALFNKGRETGLKFNSVIQQDGGWTFLNEDLEIIKIGKINECGLCGGKAETFDYRTYNYLGLADLNK